MKIDLEVGRAYPFHVLQDALEGGFPRDYLPHNHEQVFAAHLTLEKNPDAPEIVLVGRAPNVVRAAEIFSDQEAAVPTFIKVMRNEWLYKGMYRVAEQIGQSAHLRRLARRAHRRDVAFALRLEKIEQSILPDLEAIHDFVQSITAPLKTVRGQGRGLTGPERRLVENEAMRRAEIWLIEQGFDFQNVSAKQSCDFRAQRGGEEWLIEVKGTTGAPKSIIVTEGEVALHLSSHPRNALLIVHGIALSKDGSRVSGGELIAVVPWAVDKKRLRPICYTYLLS